ncbi:hypothetical protein A2U01_0097727, partial [Trifolium medium]|nr:hypothetical protein [Trifolium medium]
GALKSVLYGPKRTWSKGIPPVKSKKKNLKRKEVSSSDSEFVIEEDDVEDAGTSAKPVAEERKRARTIPYVPIYNVSF